MVLTDKQRSELHTGIYEYLLTRPGDSFARAAASLLEADPTITPPPSSPNNNNNPPSSPSSSSSTPLLEKKWTAVSRLQKKVLELERSVAQATKLHAAPRGSTTTTTTSDGGDVKRRMLPRPPAVHCLKGHGGNVTCVEVHPVFTVVCSGSEDATIKIWDHESGEYLKTLKGHTSTIHSLSFTPTGSHLASSSSDLSIKLWDFKTYTCIRTFRGHDHTISAVSFLPTPLPEGPFGGCTHLISVSRDKTVKFWELESGFCINTSSHHHEWVRCIACKTDGSMIATSGNDFVIILYKDMKRVGELRGHEHVVETLAFWMKPPSQQKQKLSTTTNKEVEQYLASGGRDRVVRLWNTQRMECVGIFAFHENWVRRVLIHPNGNYIISAGDDRSIRVFDIKSNRCLRTIENAHQHFVTSIAMHHTLPILVSGSVDQTLKCWMLD